MFIRHSLWIEVELGISVTLIHFFSRFSSVAFESKLISTTKVSVFIC